MELITIEEMEKELEEVISIPTNESAEPVYANYISNGFLSSFLSEDSDSITESLTKLKLADQIDEAAVCEALVNVQMANIGSAAKLDAMQKIVDLYAEAVELDELNEDAVMLEYAGNPEKNKALRKLMEEMEKMLQEYYDETDFVVSALDEIAGIVKKEAAKGAKANAKDAAIKVKAVYDKVDAKLGSEEAKKYVRNYNTTFKALKKVCKSFSIKFNDVVMDDKKAFDKKLDDAVKKARNNKKFLNWLPDKDWVTPAIKQFNSDLSTLRMDNAGATDQIVAYVQPVYNYGYSCIMGYIGNINYIRHILGLEKEHSIFYKILNKVIKTKKED